MEPDALILSVFNRWTLRNLSEKKHEPQLSISHFEITVCKISFDMSANVMCFYPKREDDILDSSLISF